MHQGVQVEVTFTETGARLDVITLADAKRRTAFAGPRMSRRVLVFNHFAVPLGEPGGTRHTELFARVAGFLYLIVAARHNLLTHRPQHDQAGFHFVSTTPYSSNGLSRVLNWASYAFLAAARTGFDRKFRARRGLCIVAPSAVWSRGLAGIEAIPRPIHP